MSEAFTLTDFLLDISKVSFLCMIAFLIRPHLKFTHKFYFNIGLIAGVIGLLLGEQVLGRFSPVYLTFSSGFSQWSNFLLVIIFASTFLGSSGAGNFGRDILCTTCLTGSIFMMQVIVGILIALGLAVFMKDLPVAVGLLPVSGFYGGQSSAAIMGGVFETEGWADATAIAIVYATIGMYVALICGMWFVNWGIKKGYSIRKAHNENERAQSEITGLLAPEDRKPIARAITNSSVMSPLAFQIMIIGLVVGVSNIFREAMMSVIPFWSKIPLHTNCLVLGAVIGIGLGKTKYNQYVDRGTIRMISGWCREFIVIQAIATLRLSVFADFLVPILISTVIICSLTAFQTIYLAKRWYKDNWFEFAAGIFGQCTGSLTTGLVLINIMDPEGDTLAAEGVSGSSTIGSFWQQPYNTIGAIAMLSAPFAVLGVTCGIFVVLIVAGFVLFGRSSMKRRTA